MSNTVKKLIGGLKHQEIYNFLTSTPHISPPSFTSLLYILTGTLGLKLSIWFEFARYLTRVRPIDTGSRNKVFVLVSQNRDI